MQWQEGLVQVAPQPGEAIPLRRQQLDKTRLPQFRQPRLQHGRGSFVAGGPQRARRQRPVAQFPEIFEIFLLFGFYRTVSYLANGLDLPLEQKAARFPK